MNITADQSGPILDQDAAQLVTSIVEDCSARLRMLLPPQAVPQVLLEFGVFGLMMQVDEIHVHACVEAAAQSYRHAARRP